MVKIIHRNRPHVDRRKPRWRPRPVAQRLAFLRPRGRISTSEVAVWYIGRFQMDGGRWNLAGAARKTAETQDIVKDRRDQYVRVA